ncbi:hypothetical protein [Emticicia sp. BO119]|uniref:hypothetical protein n=1 Tax=Emticicia sp. BO119 TaxID=2757768 RepID=UPI0015F111A7|nr:hypothetical protein [Emticicia sp. BO119]MBA4849036.1 hypothetical protein [Emticicia sp. BO119]
MINIGVINKTGRISQADMRRAVEAFQIQVSRDLAPVYGVDAIIRSYNVESDAPAGTWFTWIVDNIDLAGLNGYHFIDNSASKVIGTGQKGYAVGANSGLPYGIVAYRADNWTIVTSHEIIEKLVNPYLDKQAANVDVDKDGNASEDMLMEIADPVQANAYSINGVQVTNFVYPEYYTDAVALAGRKYDYMGVIAGPKEIAEGGYFSFKRGGQWWQGFKTLNVVLYKKISEKKELTATELERLIRQIFWVVFGIIATSVLINYLIKKLRK